MDNKRIVFDLDGVICEEVPTFDRSLAEPDWDVIHKMQDLHEVGWFIIIYSGRGWAEYNMTQDWLARHGVPYDLLICGKPLYDYWIDDRAVKLEDI